MSETDSPKTLATGAAPYCPVAAFLAHFDSQYAGELVNDDGTTATVSDLADHATITELLRRASGEVEMACQVGRRYSSADLTALAGDPGNGGAALRGLVADLAAGHLLRRRRVQVEDHPSVKEAKDVLHQLRGGDRIFPFVETARAGLPEVHQITRQELQRRGAITTHLRRHFGDRSWHQDY